MQEKRQNGGLIGSVIPSGDLPSETPPSRIPSGYARHTFRKKEPHAQVEAEAGFSAESNVET
jgi:hypothetical protein